MILRNNKAFLLIEVLVTVIIVSVSIIFINHAFSASLKAASVSSGYIAAALLLQDKVFDLEAYGGVEEGETSGEDRLMGKAFEWRRVVERLSEENRDLYSEEELALNTAKLSVGWLKQGARREIGISTYVPARQAEE